MSITHLIMHLDMDAFFASVEQRDNLKLIGKPVVIGALPGTRGVVSTCSYEARAFGIHSAMPISEAYRKCPSATYLKPNMKKYVKVSNQVMQLLSQISPVVEQLSVDEAFIDISGLNDIWGSPKSIGLKAKNLIKNELNLIASIGIAPNRLVAKIASDFHKPDGLTIINEEDVLEFLAPLKVSSLLGVGKKTLQILINAGIYKVLDVRSHKLNYLKQILGDKSGTSLYNYARGIASNTVGKPEIRKSISKEITFEKDIRDKEILKNTLLQLSSDVGRSLRKENLKGSVITIKIRLSDFKTYTRRKKLNQTTNIDKIIFNTGWMLLESSGFINKTIRLIGIGVSDWKNSQLNLFSVSEEKDEKLLKTVDKIVNKFGKDKIHFGLKHKLD